MSEKLVLDSFALVSLYHRGPGWQVVQRALYDQEKARSRASLSWINWGEFYYIVKRRVGHAKTMMPFASWNSCRSIFFRWINRWFKLQPRLKASMRYPMPTRSALPPPNGWTQPF